MMDHEEVLRLLRRLFKGGPMARLPKKQRESEVVMALSIVGLDPDGFYDEADINLHLSGWLPLQPRRQLQRLPVRPRPGLRRLRRVHSGADV